MCKSLAHSVVTLAEHSGIPADAEVHDEEWLTLTGQRGWAVIMKDERIRYRRSERNALVRAGIQAFCIASGNLVAADIANLLLAHEAAILELAGRPGPGFHVLTRAGFRSIALDEE